MKEQYTLSLEAISPIHIGNGEKRLPLDYKVSDELGKLQFKNPQFLAFSSDAILQKLISENKTNELKQFEMFVEKNKMRDLQFFFHEHFTGTDELDYPCEVTNEFEDLYFDKIENAAEENALEVLEMERVRGKQSPLLAGSSLKGSIRTAVLNALLNEKHNTDVFGFQYLKNLSREKKVNDTEIENKLLNANDAKDDPFRCIEIADTVFPAKMQIVGRVKNFGFSKWSDDLKEKSMQIVAEAVRGLLIDGDAKTQTTFSINTDLQKSQLDKFAIRKKITKKMIAESCNDFFISQFENEYKKFYAKQSDPAFRRIRDLKKIIDEVKMKNDENEFVIRVGRWSQVEFVTLEKIKKPKTRSNKNKKPFPYGTSRWLFEYNGNYVPFGWCKCRLEKK